MLIPVESRWGYDRGHRRHCDTAGTAYSLVVVEGTQCERTLNDKQP